MKIKELPFDKVCVGLRVRSVFRPQVSKDYGA
jgi:hypothetical protein